MLEQNHKKQETEENKDEESTKQGLPPEVTHDAWTESAARVRQNKEDCPQEERREITQVKIASLANAEEEYLQMPLNCEAYGAKCNGKQMPNG